LANKAVSRQQEVAQAANAIKPIGGDDDSGFVSPIGLRESEEFLLAGNNSPSQFVILARWSAINPT
jgi:hypothetical protein